MSVHIRIELNCGILFHPLWQKHKRHRDTTLNKIMIFY